MSKQTLHSNYFLAKEDMQDTVLENIDVKKFLDMPIDEVCRGDFSEFNVLDALDTVMSDL